MGMKQVTAVVNCTKIVLGNAFEAGRPILEYISDADTGRVEMLVAQGITSGEVDYGKDKSDLKEVMKYVRGMVNNHFRKCKELNGGVKYEAKNPGIRAGSSDPVVKTLRQLLKTDKVSNDPEAKAAIETEIAQRIANMKPKTTAKTVSIDDIDMSLVPDSIKDIVS